jgi:hypothetical protein
MTGETSYVSTRVIPGRGRKTANPESRNSGRASLWIPGPALARRLGMTGRPKHGEWWVTPSANRPYAHARDGDR